MKYTHTNENISVIHEGKTYVVNRTSPNFLPLLDCLVKENYADAVQYLSMTVAIDKWESNGGKFKVLGGVLKFRLNDPNLDSLSDDVFVPEYEAVQDSIASKVIQMLKEGENATPLLNFYERLQRNPSYNSIQQLYRFLSNLNIPLTERGTFLAYKSVRSNYMDWYSNTVDNTPGRPPITMRRKDISDDPKDACHKGLHVGSLAYATGFHAGEGQKVVVTEVDPEHVVCVPHDESSGKMRVCEYSSIGNYVTPLTSSVERDIPKVRDSEEKKEPEAKSVTKTPPRAVVNLLGSSVVTPNPVTKQDTPDFTTMSLDALRKYAVHELHIVGASKIPGGKDALIKVMKEYVVKEVVGG